VPVDDEQLDCTSPVFQPEAKLLRERRSFIIAAP
jgi:hypothetical protein